ncbi:MAG: hypothetical protein U9N86_16310 [Bacteroidota bacterium]|nr:hypothetical protein [Bacteroidota bacterium]
MRVFQLLNKVGGLREIVQDRLYKYPEYGKAGSELKQSQNRRYFLRYHIQEYIVQKKPELLPIA